MTKKSIYKIIFMNQGEVYEIYARQVFQGSFFGFVEVEELIFGEKSAVLVDPSEERLKSEFCGVKRIFIPLHAVIRIDEVEKQGTGKIHKTSDSENNVTQLSVYTTGGDSNKK